MSGTVPVLSRKELRTYYVDGSGVIRRRSSGRKRRSDYGTRRPHPVGCLHCESVREYHDMRATACEARGGWRNEHWSDGVPTFKDWLVMNARNRHVALVEGLIA